MTDVTICDIRETDLAFCVPPDTIPRQMLATALAAIYDDIGGVRDAVMNIWGLCGISAAAGRHREFGAAPWSLESLACLFAYGSGYLGGGIPDPRKAIHIMNIDGMVTACDPLPHARAEKE